MARLPRLYVPGCSHHIIQRGNNRCACFFEKRDYAFYLQQLDISAKKFGVAIHAFALMTNHVHLMVTPSEAGSCGNMMQSLGRKYVRYINLTYQRTGSLWEGRYKSTLIDSDTYCLCLYRYIESNPVRAKMVADPAEYTWSSYRSNALGKHIKLLTPHPVYTALSSTQAQRLLCYRALFDGEIPIQTMDEIRECTNKGWLLGGDKFKQEIADHANRRLSSSGWGGDRRSVNYRRQDQGV